MKPYLDKVGPMGSVFAVLCCIGTPGLLPFLSAIGAGFLANDAILLALLVFFLTVSMVGLYYSFEMHKNRWPMIMGGIGSLFILSSTYGWFLKSLVYVGLVGLVGTSVWNLVLKKRCQLTEQP
jgi:mercuric ion transport protein